MSAAIPQPLVFHPPPAGSELARRLRDAVAGAVLVDSASRGRYATDASIYQVEPIGVLVPTSDDDVRAAFDVCRELDIPMLPRGAGSSQCGQTVGAALVIDHSKHLNRVLDFDREALTATVEPGVVLDQLNAYLKPHGVWFPVDVSTSAQATLGRHGRQQLVRVALDRLRQHGAQRRGHRRAARRRDDRTLRARRSRCRARRRACARCSMGCAPSVRASATRSRAGCPRCCAASAATTSTCFIHRACGRTPPTAASTSHTCWSAAKVRSPGRAGSRCSSRRCPGIARWAS